MVFFFPPFSVSVVAVRVSSQIKFTTHPVDDLILKQSESFRPHLRLVALVVLWCCVAFRSAVVCHGKLLLGRACLCLYCRSLNHCLFPELRPWPLWHCCPLASMHNPLDWRERQEVCALSQSSPLTPRCPQSNYKGLVGRNCTLDFQHH